MPLIKAMSPLPLLLPLCLSLSPQPPPPPSFPPKASEVAAAANVENVWGKKILKDPSTVEPKKVHKAGVNYI